MISTPLCHSSQAPGTRPHFEWGHHPHFGQVRRFWRPDSSHHCPGSFVATSLTLTADFSYNQSHIQQIIEKADELIHVMRRT
ncbi:MAG TPA: hypothetical protein PK490_00950 [Prosthecobacter sp.]|nr:hypothetical protein [Prosthecobacter sp.]